MLHTLAGHHGVVYTVAWNRQGTHLVSGGDDRSVKVWYAGGGGTDSGGGSASSPPALLWSSFGHSARVWDCIFLDGEGGAALGPAWVASTSQDATVRRGAVVAGCSTLCHRAMLCPCLCGGCWQLTHPFLSLLLLRCR